MELIGNGRNGSGNDGETVLKQRLAHLSLLLRTVLAAWPEHFGILTQEKLRR